MKRTKLLIEADDFTDEYREYIKVNGKRTFVTPDVANFAKRKAPIEVHNFRIKGATRVWLKDAGADLHAKVRGEYRFALCRSAMEKLFGGIPKAIYWRRVKVKA